MTHRQASNNVKAVGQWIKRLCACVKTKRHHFEDSAKLKPTLFRVNTLHNRLFSEPPPRFDQSQNFLHPADMQTSDPSPTPVLTRFVEKNRSSQFSLPRFSHTTPSFSFQDQYAFWPTGSTTAASNYIYRTTHSPFEKVAQLYAKNKVKT